MRVNIVPTRLTTNQNQVVVALSGIQIMLEEAHTLKELLETPRSVLMCLQLQRNALCARGSAHFCVVCFLLYHVRIALRP